MTCAQLRTKTQISISRKMRYIKSRFQILYAVNSQGNFRLCNRIELKLFFVDYGNS